MSTEQTEPETEPEHWVEVTAHGMIHRWPDDTYAWTVREDHLVVVALHPEPESRVGEPMGRRPDPFAGGTEVARFREWTSVVRTRDLETFRNRRARMAQARLASLG